MKQRIFKGAATALYTPFTDGKPDLNALSELIERQISQKIDALVVLGTTGESPTVNDKERTEIIKTAVKQAKKRVPIIVGCGSNCTARFIELTNRAKMLGADAALAVTPYYNKCNEEGLFRHYAAADKICKFPTIVYNVPSRTGLNVRPETYKKLAEIDSVVGIKEACMDLNQIDGDFKTLGGYLPIYCGSDEMNFEFFRRGASGTISVLSNIIPLKIHNYFYNFERDYKNEKNDKDYIFEKLSNLLFSDVNPIPLKALAEKYHKKGYELRLPLTKLCESKKQKLYEEFDKLLKLLKETD